MCLGNLIHILPTIGTTRLITYLHLQLWQIVNKDLIISQELNDHKIDITVITETWLKDTPEDKVWTKQSELIQGNYKVKLHNRLGPQKGGGIALINKNQYSVQELEKGNTTTIEYAVWKVKIRNKSLQVIGIYHPTKLSG